MTPSPLAPAGAKLYVVPASAADLMYCIAAGSQHWLHADPVIGRFADDDRAVQPDRFTNNQLNCAPEYTSL